MIEVDLRNLKRITNKVYYPLYKNQDRYLIMYGGAGSGKSVFAAQKCLYRILTEGYHRILVIRKVSRTLRNSSFALLRDMLPTWGLDKIAIVNRAEMSIVFPQLHSQILFLGVDDPEKLKSISGITSIWVEEATELNPDDWKQIDLRLRGKTRSYKQIVLTFNPISVNHWIRKQFFNSQVSSSKIIHSTYQDNRFIDSEYKEVLEQLKYEDKEYYKIYTKGEWGTHGNMIYTNWQLVSSVPDNMDEEFCGLDFGYNNPSACVKIGIKDGEYYVLDELYRSHLTNSDLIEMLKPFAGELEIYADSAEPNRIEEMQRAGLNVTPAVKNVKDGIDFVKRQKLYIDPKFSNTLKELEGYKWQQDRAGNVLDKPVKYMDHAMDAMRYAIYTHAREEVPTVRVIGG